MPLSAAKCHGFPPALLYSRVSWPQRASQSLGREMSGRPALLPSLCGVGEHHVTHQGVEIGAGRNELPKRPSGRSKRVELPDCETLLRIRPPEVGEILEELATSLEVDWIVDPRLHLDIAGVEALLPRVGR